MQQQLEISLAIFVPFIVANANGPEYAAIGPTDWDAQVRDHPQLDMRVCSPCFVLESVRDEQRLTGLHDGLAIRSRIESVRLARISFGRAGDENLDVGRIDPHYGGRGHVHDLGKEIHKLLPFSDEFRGLLRSNVPRSSGDLAAQRFFLGEYSRSCGAVPRLGR
jgi:hypothetical protein